MGSTVQGMGSSVRMHIQSLMQQQPCDVHWAYTQTALASNPATSCARISIRPSRFECQAGWGWVSVSGGRGVGSFAAVLASSISYVFISSTQLGGDIRYPVMYSSWLPQGRNQEGGWARPPTDHHQRSQRYPSRPAPGYKHLLLHTVYLIH